MTKNKHSYAIDILRVLLAFGVVLCHYWSPETETGLNSVILAWRQNAASAFFLLSFFLTGSRFLTNDQDYLKKRLKRLLIPYFVWGLFGWVVYAAVHCFGMSIRKVLMGLFWQMLVGHGDAVNSPLWFLAVLCWLTALYAFLFRKLKQKQAVIVICILAVLSFILQATGIHVRLFSVLPFEAKYPLGRTVEMIPYATAGILLSAVLQDKEIHLSAVLVSVAVVVCYLCFPEFLSFEGFGYSGLMKLAASISLILIALYLDSYISKDSWKSVIRTISLHTLGIYCMHYDVGLVISRLVFISNSFLLCIVIYTLCYFIAAGIARIPRLRPLVD